MNVNHSREALELRFRVFNRLLGNNSWRWQLDLFDALYQLPIDSD